MIGFEKYLFDTFEEAMDIHKRLFRLIREKHVVTYLDLYNMIHENEENSFSIDEYEMFRNYGWNNLFYCKVEPFCDKWALVMPEIIKLNVKEK